jgi:Mn-dependent DtxR family transcriptional regulator
MDPEHRAELLRLVKGSPQPEVNVGAAAERMGVSVEEAREMVSELEREGSLRRHAERWVVVEPAAWAAPDDQPVP